MIVAEPSVAGASPAPAAGSASARLSGRRSR